MAQVAEITHQGKNGTVTVIHDKPPCFDNICATFNIVPKNTFFSYGDCVYSPDIEVVPDHIIEHEKIHLRQQGFTKEGAALWWGKFLRDPKFRLEQELEAYARQYQYFCSQTSDREKVAKFLWQLAGSLSGPLYERCITHYEAMNKIKNYKRINILS